MVFNRRVRAILLIVAVCVTMAMFFAGTEAKAQGGNYYYGGDGCVSPTQLYPCPMQVPPVVGYTYITYQPLNPHEMMYCHARVYVTDHYNALPTRTKVLWW